MEKGKEKMLMHIIFKTILFIMWPLIKNSDLILCTKDGLCSQKLISICLITHSKLYSAKRSIS